MLRLLLVTVCAILLLLLDVALSLVVFSASGPPSPHERIPDVTPFFLLFVAVTSCSLIVVVHIVSRFVSVTPSQVYGALGAVVLVAGTTVVMGGGDATKGMRYVHDAFSISPSYVLIYVVLVAQCFFGSSLVAKPSYGGYVRH